MNSESGIRTIDEILKVLEHFTEPRFKEEKLIYCDNTSLTAAQREANLNAYSNGAGRNHVLHTQFDKKVETSAEQNIFDPFMRLMEARNSNPSEVTILYPGSGAGRDAIKAIRRGYDVVALDLSPVMLKFAHMFLLGVLDPEAISVVVNGEEKLLADLFVCCDVLQPTSEILQRRYDGIYAESLAAHLDHEETLEMVTKYSALLKEGGIFMLGLRLTEKGKVYEIQDASGSRFFTSYSKKLIQDPQFGVEAMANCAGLDLISYDIHPHPFEGRPGFLDIFFKKK